MGRRRIVVCLTIVIMVVAVASVGVAWMGERHVLSESIAWQSDLDDPLDVIVVDGEVYRFTWGSSPSGWTVQRLNPSDGTAERTWSHPSLARPSITANGQIVFTSRQSRPGSDVQATDVALYSTDDDLVWQTSVEHGTDQRVYTTAAHDDAVHVAVCGPGPGVAAPPRGRAGESASMVDAGDVVGCRLLRIDRTGRVAGSTSVYAPGSVQTLFGAELGAEWADRAGRELPIATLALPDLRRIELFSPMSASPLATLPYTTAHHAQDMILTSDRLITVERTSDGCTVRGRPVSLDDRGEWATPLPCGSTDVFGLTLTQNPRGAPLLGVADAIGGRLRMYTLDVVGELQRTGSADGDQQPLIESPVVSSAAVAEEVRRRTVPGYVVDLTDGVLVAQGFYGTSVSDRIDVPGSGSRALAGWNGDIAVATRNPELPWTVRMNPLVDADSLHAVQMVGLGQRRVYATALFSSPIVDMYALDDGNVLVWTEKTIAVVAA